jgi:GH25 family lysozyme M1 (1,4-beta-N-acetylmuramidase)
MIVGVDFAAVDGNDYVKWPKYMSACSSAGSTASIAIFRGAWGTSPDITVQREWKRAQSYGLVTGAYLYLRMRADQAPQDQVHVFADNLGSITSKDLVPIIDVENTGLPAEAELEYVHRAALEMRAIYGVWPMIYVSDRVWHEDLHDLPAGELTDCPLWVAKPWPWAERTPGQLSGSLFATDHYDPIVPKPWGWGNWWMHQYQGDAVQVPGFTHTVDLSRFHVMRQGEIGVRVAWVQRRMGWPVTRTFDAAMAARVRTLQSDHALAVDGVIGPRTFPLIAWTMPPGAPIAA